MSHPPTEATAFGKLILLGEHAVVYGAPALVLGVDLRCDARAEVGGEGRQLKLLSRHCDAADDDELSRAFAALLEEGGAPDDITVTVSGDLPPGVGLGFSAAAAVAAAHAVGGVVGDRSDDAVRKRATAWERVFHGNPSGVDVAAAMHGGCTRFSRDGDGNVTVSRVHVKEPLTLCVGLTGTRSSTKTMVEGLADLRERNTAMVDKSIEAIATLVENAIGAVSDGNMVALGELMNLNQMLLAGLMLSNDDIEKMVSAAREAGALGAKLTGAGGGGAVVALAGTGQEAEATAERVVGAWKAIGFDGFATRLGRHGPNNTEETSA